MTASGSGLVAVLGGGGREHALVWRLLQDGRPVVALPGSDAIPGSVPVDLESDPEVVAELRRLAPSLVVIGPEAPLERGLADTLRAEGFAVLGPGKAGARLESSKAFAKDFMVRHGVATARHETVVGLEAGLAALSHFPGGVVVKYDGLAAGKGVIVCADRAEAEAAIRELAARHGDGATLLLEERLVGREVSLLALTDGRDLALFPPAQDHKRLGDGDTGPNTGGMGAYCPVPFCNAAVLAEIDAQIVQPTLRGLARDGIAFRGILYFGVMVTAAGPRLLEYNTRFGDPEAQAVLPQVKGDLGALFLATARGEVGSSRIESHAGYTVAVVAAAAGYPGAPVKGTPIEGLDVADALVFHAGTRRAPGGTGFVTAGGRVLSVVARGDSFRAARARAYAAAEQVRFAGMQRRSDVGKQAEPKRIAILFSGRGSNMEAILASIREGELQGFAEPVLAVTDKPDAKGIEVAKRFDVPVATQPSKGIPRADYDATLAGLLQTSHVDYVVLAGFMRILSPVMVRAFPRRILNVHPADTRAHQGLHGYAWAFEAKLPETWVTIHWVDEGLDTGPVIHRARVDLTGATTLEEVERRGLAVEHREYGHALKNLILEQA